MEVASRRYRPIAFLQSSTGRPRRENLKLRPPSLPPHLRLAGGLLANRQRVTPTGASPHRSAAAALAAHAPSRWVHAGAVGSRRQKRSARRQATALPVKQMRAAGLAVEIPSYPVTRSARKQRPPCSPPQAQRERMAPAPSLDSCADPY